MSVALALVLLAQVVPPSPRLVPPPPNPPQVKSAPNAAELLGKLDQSKDLKDRDKPFEIAASLGKLYYAHGRFKDAAVYLQQATAKAALAREYYLQMRKKAGSKPMPAPGSVGCAPPAEVSLADQLTLAKRQSDPAAAAACVRVGLTGLIDVETELGNAQFLMHESLDALGTFDRALELFESNADARYGRAAVLIDLRGDDLMALGSAKADLEKLLKDYPTTPKAKSAKRLLDRTVAAIAAGGMTKLAAQAPKPQVAEEGAHPPMLTKEMVEAVQNVEQNEDTAKGFAKLVDEAETHLAKGEFQDALDNYKRVVPFQPENARARAGMAWSLVRLNKQPMADNIWRVASTDPKAIDSLGDTLKSKGDEAGAKMVWQRLKETVPSYAEALGSKAP